MTGQPNFFKVATRPKWIGGLLLALAVAAVFALLAQWQIDRTYRYIPKTPTNQKVVELQELADPSSPFQPAQADRLVSLMATPIPGQAYVIKNRVQLVGESEATGAWLVRPATDADGKFVTLALGWYPTVKEAQVVAETLRGLAEDMSLREYTGIYEPTEDPRPSEGNTFESLSIPQLINLPGIPETVDAYAGFVIVQSPTEPGHKIVIGNNPGQNIFNWLTAFYALEWILFAGAAVFLWWRTVRDQVIRETVKDTIN